MLPVARTFIAAGILVLVLVAVAVRASLEEPAVELAVLDTAMPGDPVADLLLAARNDPLLFDGFDSDGEGLGRPNGGQDWVDLGDWVTIDGVARLRPTAESTEPFLAIVDVPPRRAARAGGAELGCRRPRAPGLADRGRPVTVLTLCAAVVTYEVAEAPVMRWKRALRTRRAAAPPLGAMAGPS